MEMTPTELTIGFLFATVAFAAIVYYVWKKIRPEFEGLRVEVIGLRAELKNARAELSTAEKGRKLLISKIDRLILRRDELLTCLAAAKTDEEKVACIYKLMGEDGPK